MREKKPWKCLQVYDRCTTADDKKNQKITLYNIRSPRWITIFENFWTIEPVFTTLRNGRSQFRLIAVFQRERERENIVAERLAFLFLKNCHYVYTILPFELISIPKNSFFIKLPPICIITYTDTLLAIGRRGTCVNEWTMITWFNRMLYIIKTMKDNVRHYKCP